MAPSIADTWALYAERFGSVSLKPWYEFTPNAFVGTDTPVGREKSTKTEVVA